MHIDQSEDQDICNLFFTVKIVESVKNVAAGKKRSADLVQLWQRACIYKEPEKGELVYTRTRGAKSDRFAECCISARPML